MSSFIGHTLTALTIHSSVKERSHSIFQQIGWLGWLAIIASAPDLDYFIAVLHRSSHQNVRISHSIGFALLLPICTILVLFLLGMRGRSLKIRSGQVVLTGLSHLVLDLLVGVMPLGLFWPLTTNVYKLPFGLLPSAGQLNLTNYYFYYNLFIELGVLLPILYSIYLTCRTPPRTGWQRVAIVGLLLISAYFMKWAYALSR